MLGLIASTFAAVVITNNAKVDTDGFRSNHEIDYGTVVKATGVNDPKGQSLPSFNAFALLGGTIPHALTTCTKS